MTGVQTCALPISEALSCGCTPIGINPIGGSIEIVNKWEQGAIPSIQDMGNNYKQIFSKLLEDV